MASGLRFRVTTLLLLALAGVAVAHEHHEDEIPEGSAVSAEPLDSVLWIHIVLQTIAFGLIFPTGMVLGLVKSRFHVPLQILGTIVAVVGWFMGHAHQGRQFGPNAHASFANKLMLMLMIQIGLGIYLRLHLERGVNGRLRPYLKAGHSVLGKVMPVVSWVQILFGGIAALGFCQGEHLGQCLAHFIMGSAFIGYGIVLTIIMLVGQAWLRRTGRSQEFFDSMLIAAWGLVNTFTEHHWGGPWVGNDLQHTTMGVIWWCAGLAGVWLSRTRDGRPKRNFIPGFVIFITGWAMSAHPQHLMLSTMVHTMFGYTLMAAGLSRIIEIAFVLKDANTVSEEGDANSFQHIPPFLLYASGFIFMGATEEQMELLSNAGVSHVSYILILYSFAFLMFLFTHVLIHLYVSGMGPPSPPPKDPERGGHAVNGANGHASLGDARRVHDAQEFELEGLMSDNDEDALEVVPTSPSTLGRNNVARVE